MTEQGKSYAAFIEGEVKAEQQRRASLDTRGLAVVTTSGSLTTLLAAVGAFVTSRDGFVLPSGTIIPLTVTLMAFSLAALCGLLASHNRQYFVAGQETLALMVGERWPTSEVDARNVVADIHTGTVSSLREGNNGKAALLMAGLGLQLLGLAALSVAVFLVLLSAH